MIETLITHKDLDSIKANILSQYFLRSASSQGISFKDIEKELRVKCKRVSLPKIFKCKYGLIFLSSSPSGINNRAHANFIRPCCNISIHNTSNHTGALYL